MENKKYQVFISSTYTDLKETRKTVSDTILKMYHFPVGMELFSAGDTSQWETITKIIDKTDYYILILGHRYGSLGPNDIGYTEMEYDYAKSKGIPILAFIQSNDVATKPTERESDPKFVEKLEKFREKATANKMCDFWKIEDDLASKVSMALYKSFTNKPRIGWIRGDQGASPEVANEMALLTKENRELKKQLEKINTIERTPKIEVLFNDKNKVELDMKDFSKDRYPKGMSYEEIPERLKKYIKKEDINKYNSLVDSNKEIESYIKKINNYRNIEINKEIFNLTISNNGNLKANNIMIDIDFPKEVLIMEKKDVKKLSIPISPLPKHPLNVAKERFERENREVRNSSLQSMSLFNKMEISSLGEYNMPTFDYSMDHLIPVDPNRWLCIKEGEVTCKLSKLLHTRCTTFDGRDSFYLIPLKKGEFAIKIHIICEEMIQREEIIVPVIIE